jgi:nucleotide-binding universal stress UspA family protein
MKKTVSGNVQGGDIPSGQINAEAAIGLRKVALIIEYGGLEREQPVVSFPDLRRFLSPEHTELTVAHAEFDWVGMKTDAAEEAHNVGALVAGQETKLHEMKRQIDASLQDSGFSVVRELECGTRDRHLKSLLTTLEEGGQDLLIVVSQPDLSSHPKTSHFVRTLVTHAPCSVLLLRKTVAATHEPLKVMLGVDGSEASMNAARQLKQILPDCEMRLELVTAQSPIYQENAVLAPYVNQDVLNEALEANAKMIFEIVSDILENQGVSVSERRKLVGSPATELGNLAELEHPDLMIVGSHNRTGVLAWLMGSVSSQLLHWDTHNLLVVR